MMQQCDTLVADALWETIHSEVQDFVQNTLATMLRTTFRKKKDLSRQYSNFTLHGIIVTLCNLIADMFLGLGVLMELLMKVLKLLLETQIVS